MKEDRSRGELDEEEFVAAVAERTVANDFDYGLGEFH